MTSNSESLPLIDYDEQAVSFHKRTETMSTLELISESNLQQCVFLLGNLLNQESAEFMSYTSVENEPCENYSNGGSLKRQRRPTSTQCSNSNHKRRKNLHLTSLDFNSLLVEPNVSDIKVKTGEISDHFIHENDSEGISDKSSNTIEDSDCEKTRILQVDGASDDVEQSILHQNVGSSSKEVGQIAMVGSRMPVADGIQFYEHLESRPSRFLNFDGSSRMLMAPVMGSDSQSPSLSYFGGTSGSPSPQSFQFNPRLSSFANSNHKQQMTQFDPFPFPVNAVLSPSQPPSEYLQSSHYSSFNSPYGFPLGKNWLQMKQHEQERLPPRKKGHFPWRQSPPKADHRQQDGVCQRFPNFHAFEQNYVGANSSYIPQANRFNNSYLPQAFSSNIPRHGSPYLDPSPFSISAQLPDKHRQSSPRCMDSQDMGEIFLDQKLHKIRQNRSLSHHDRESNLYNSKSSESFTCNFDVNVSSHPHSSSQSSVIGKPKIASPLKSPMGSIATSNTSEDFLRNQNSNTSCSPGWLSQSLRLPAYNSIPSSSIPNGSLQSSFVQQWPPTMATSSCSNSRDENQQNSAQLAGHQKQHRLIREKSKPVEDFDNYVEQKQNDASLGGGTTKLCHLSVENEMLDRNNVENKKHTGKPTLSEIAQKNDTDTLNSKIERLSSCSSEMATSIGSVSRFHPLDGIQSYPSSDGIYEDRMRNPFQFLKSDESRNANEYVRNSVSCKNRRFKRY